MTDTTWMRYALELALRGTGRVSPNPRVGCVIVRGDDILAEGWHDVYGGPHAEAHALATLTSSPADATLYVNLEPCAHQGKTGPCADAIIASGIRRVVVGMTDPYFEVAGRGIERMRAAGIDVVTDVCLEECMWLNRYFVHFVTTHRPWVILKVAQSIDGCIAPAHRPSAWITNEASRARVHALRSEVDAVLTGIGTVMSDDPLLTVRAVAGRDPIRIVMDRSLRIPLDSNLVRTAASTPLVVYCDATISTGVAADALRTKHVQVYGVPTRDGRLDLDAMLLHCGSTLSVTSILVEAGGVLSSALLETDVVDELRLHTAPVLLGSGVHWNVSTPATPDARHHFALHDVDYVDGDLHSTYLPVRTRTTS